MLATFFISARDWLGLAGLAVAVAALVLAWAYWGGQWDRFRITGFVLKLFGVALLAVCLVEPMWSAQRVQPGANFFAILADNSQGMRIHDRGEPDSRGQKLKRQLTNPDLEWQNELEGTFKVRRYRFDSRLQYSRDFSELGFDGPGSALGGALGELQGRYEGRPLAGVLLFTDGNATDIDRLNAIDPTVPIYPVVIGSSEPLKDLALTRTSANETAFEDTPINIHANVRAIGYSGRSIGVRVVDQSGNVVDRQEKRPDEADTVVPYHFQIQPTQLGVTFYQLDVYRKKADLDAASTDPNAESSSEATLINNRRVVVVNRDRDPLRILYVAGRPNWEYKFLNRAMSVEDQIRLVGLVRIADREPKFEFKGRAGESSNPLYRGFDKKDETTERYDQPVFVRLNTRDKEELMGGFPTDPEGLFEYEAVIVDDLSADFFSYDQLSLIQRFVSQRGGGFLMLGGQESFRQGGFDDTPIRDILPVYLNRAPAEPAAGDFDWRLTREGWLQPWVRLRDTEAAERERLDAMPAFRVLNPVHDLKPGASLLAELVDENDRRFPALAVQPFGLGRSAALMVGDFWRWGLREPEMQQDMAKAWRQMLRWLVADVPQRVDLQVADASGHQTVELKVKVRDETFQPMEDVRVQVHVAHQGASLVAKQEGESNQSGTSTESNDAEEGKAGQTVTLTAEPSAEEAGLYTVTYICRERGGYHATATVTGPGGLTVGEDEVGWAADPLADEFESLQPNRPALERLARESGGRVVNEQELGDFVGRLPNRQAPVMESWSFPLWHTPTVFLLALAFLVAEWGLRRWRGMP